MKRVFLSVLISLFLLAGLTGNNKAHEVAGPKGPVILTITGNIHHNNRGASDMFSDALSARNGARAITGICFVKSWRIGAKVSPHGN